MCIKKKTPSCTRTVVYFSPFRRFVNRRDDLNIESDDADDWEVQTLNHAKQLDSVNCGIYVIKVKNGIHV